MLGFFKNLFSKATENADVLNQVGDMVKDKVAGGNEILGNVVDKVVETVTGGSEEAAQDSEEPQIETPQEAVSEELVSPLTGTVVELSQVLDPVFASGALGKGVAVEPTVGQVLAPADATVTTLFPTKHAIGLTTTTGVELLIHVGMDTVSLEGQGFTAHVNQGDVVTKGQLLVEFDMAFIQSKELPLTTPVIVTNSSGFSTIIPVSQETVNAGDLLITVEK